LENHAALEWTAYYPRESNHANILHGNQDIDLFEQPLEAFLEPLKEPRRFPVVTGNDFDLDNIVDKIHAAVLPRSLIRGVLGTDRQRAKNGDQFLTNLFDLLWLDLAAVVVFQWEVNLIPFHAAREDLRRRTLWAVSFLKGIFFRLSIFVCSGPTP
jgi:hypothetical protein